MAIEFLEIKDTLSLYRVAKSASIVIRRDPFLIIPFYRMTFFLDLRKFKDEEIPEIFRALGNKMVIVERAFLESSLTDFINRHIEDGVK